MDLASALNLILGVFGSFSQMAGIAALVVAIINVLKVFHVVTDNNSPQWFAGLDFAAIAGLCVLQFVKPELGLSIVDSNAGLIAAVVMLVLGYIASMGVAPKIHRILATSKIPLIGKSFSR